MSIVGIAMCQDGFAAVADSKSTHYTELKTPTEDEFKPQKIFKGDNFLMVTYNRNQIWVHNDLGMLQRMMLEQWINIEIKNCSNYLDLLWNLQEALQRYRENDPANTYSFIIGSLDDSGPFVQHVHVSKEQCIINLKNREEKAYWGGADYYYNKLTSLSLKIPYLCEDAKDVLKENVEKVIYKADEINSYNPAGLPICTEVMLF